MKKLVFFDHNGQQVFQSDVFVDGQDYIQEFDRPTALWLGAIILMDEEAYLKYREEKEGARGEVITEITPELEELEEGLNSEGLSLLEPEHHQKQGGFICSACDYKGNYNECVAFGHNDWLCPQCGAEGLMGKSDVIPEDTCPPHWYDEERQCKICGHQEEVKDESEELSDKSAGDQGSSETGKLKDTPAPVKKRTKRQAAK